MHVKYWNIEDTNLSISMPGLVGSVSCFCHLALALHKCILMPHYNIYITKYSIQSRERPMDMP